MSVLIKYEMFEKFKKILFDFLSELIVILNNEPILIIFKSFLNTIPTEIILKNYIEKVYNKYNDNIRKRDNNFFYYADELFKEYKEVKLFSKILDLDKDDIDTTWEWINILNLVAGKCQQYVT